MFVLMRFGSYIKNGHPIWHDKIFPLKPSEKPPLNGKHAYDVMKSDLTRV